MANLMSVRLNKGDSHSWGFRLQGGKDFGTPLVIQKITGGSPAERAGLIAGDTVVRINNVDVYNLRHKDAQDVILRAGPSFEIAIHRGGSTWQPSVTPIGSVPSPRPAAPLSNVSPVTATSLAAGRQENIGAIGTSHNLSAKPYQVNGGPKFVNKQYNSPLPLYSEQSIAETLSAQSEVLSNGVLGVNFKKNEKSYDSENSAVFRMVQEADKEPRDEPEPESGVITTPSLGVAGLRHVYAPENKPAPPTPQLPPGQNICADCERLIVGVFVRIKDKNLHVECFKCATCGTSLKNVGYYNLNNKLYCDVHAKLAARNNPPAPNLVPVTVPPGGIIPAGTISAALSSHSLPSAAPLSPNINYSAAPYYQPSNTNYSSPRPFSSVNAPVSPPSTYSKLSPTPASTTPISESRGVQSIVWPPIQNEPELPTASPLYFPPPSQVQIQSKSKETKQIDEKDCSELEEMSHLTSHCDRNMSLCSAEVSSITGRRSVLECTETISDTIDTQILVESIVQNRPKSPPPRPKSPPPIRSDVSVTFTIAESDLKKAPYATSQADVTGCKTVQTSGASSCSLKETKQQDLSCTSKNVHETSQVIENKTSSLIDTRQQQCLASMYEKKIKVENTVPQKWESPMVVALTVASDKPYSQTETKEETQEEISTPDAFSQIPTKSSTSALASALATAPAEPFTPVHPMSSISTEPVPLPEETIPYFPPEHPTVIERKEESKSEEDIKGPETKPKKPFTKKKSMFDDELFKDLPKPTTGRISMLSALTTAPDRPYSPFGSEVPLYKTEHSEESTTNVAETVAKKDSKSTAITDRKQEKVIKSKEIAKVATSTPKAYSPYYSAFSTLHQTSTIESDQSKSSKASAVESLQKKQSVQQSVDTSVSSTEQSKSEVVSKNIQSAEDITNVSSGIPPVIQMVRGSFETKTDKVQMEMTCQFPGPPIVKKEIIKKTTTTQDTVSQESHKKAASERKQISQSSQEQEASRLKIQQESASVKQAQRTILQDTRKSDSNTKVSESAFIQKATLQTRDDIQSNQSSDLLHTEVARTVVKEPASILKKTAETEAVPFMGLPKEPVKIIQPGQTNLNVPNISFQPVSDNLPQKTTFSPRPSSLTPSMINKPPPIIPPYQASLVAVQCLAPQINVFDPSSPGPSRSPSPYPGRSPSPFPLSAGRATSPAPGPPPNPMGSHKSATELIRESKLEGARSHLQSYIPQMQSRTVTFDTQDSYGESAYTQQRVGGSSVMQQSEQQRQLSEKANLQSQSMDTRREGTTQIQKKKKVTEEYEHSQKSKVVQIEKMSTDSQFRTSQTQSTAFHLTNPQPIKSVFTSQDESYIDKIASKKEKLQAEACRKTHLSSETSKSNKTIPESSGSLPSASTSSSVIVNKPNVSHPNAGTGGRQAGAIGVAPRRGRGILNLAASPGSRVPLCAQCHSNIRGPFVTALGKIWCPDHFVCATPSCRRPLHDLGFVEERGQLYCEYCFEQYIAPPCAKCGAKVKGDCLKAIGKNFHPECFNCVYCGKLFGNNPFFLEDSQPYCEADWNELFTTKCFACGFPVEAGDRWVEALNNNYHSQCFNCTMCKKNLEGQSFFAKGGRPFCKNHAR